MKKIIKFLIMCLLIFVFVGCGTKSKSAIELMGAGDRIHDSYTFANIGVELSENNENEYTISGYVEKLNDQNVRNEFGIDGDVTHVVAVKLSAVNENVVKEEVEIYTNGNEAYDAEHLNGSDYTFIILQAIPNNDITISVKWNKNAPIINYVIHFDESLELK